MERRRFLQFAATTWMVGCGSGESFSGFGAGGQSSNSSASTFVSQNETYLGATPSGVLRLVQNGEFQEISLGSGQVLVRDRGIAASGWLNLPRAAVMDQAGTLFVVDGQLLVYRPGATSPEVYTLPGDSSRALSVALEPATGLLYVGDLLHRIVVLDQAGRYLREFGGLTHLNCPGGLAFDSQGFLHVSDFGRRCISVFRGDGTFLRSYGQGQLLDNRDLSILADGRIVVADGYGRTFHIFDASGTRLEGFQILRSDRRPVAPEKMVFFENRAYITDHLNTLTSV